MLQLSTFACSIGTRALTRRGSQVPVGAAAGTDRKRDAGKDVLAHVDLPATQDGVHDSAPIEPALALADRQFVNHVRAE